MLALHTSSVRSSSTATKRLGRLLALWVRGVLWTRCASTVATKGAKRRMGLTGAVAKPKDRALTLIPLKRSST